MIINNHIFRLCHFYCKIAEPAQLIINLLKLQLPNSLNELYLQNTIVEQVQCISFQTTIVEHV